MSVWSRAKNVYANKIPKGGFQIVPALKVASLLLFEALPCRSGAPAGGNHSWNTVSVRVMRGFA
jgi:hypothetical protein